MFERFTDRARQAVVLAEEEARSLEHGYVGTEHLLLGILAEGTNVGATVLGHFGVRYEAVRDEVRREVARGYRPAGDAEALRAIGIDLDAVRRKAEEAFGSGALDRPRRGRGRRGRLRGRAWSPWGGRPFTSRAKKVLELSLREALRLRHNYVGTEHLLLGLVREDQGLAALVLVRSGAGPEAVRARVLAELGRVA